MDSAEVETYCKWRIWGKIKIRLATAKCRDGFCYFDSSRTYYERLDTVRDVNNGQIAWNSAWKEGFTHRPTSI